MAKFRKLYDDLYMIDDMCQCYLLLGRDRALLVDTGLGSVDLARAVRAVTDKPVVVVNTHAHLDHAGGNYRFPEVLIHHADEAVGALHQTPAFRNFLLQRMPAIMRLLLGGKIRKTAELHARYIDESETVDLGDRVVRILHTPGHTEGSCCFFDEKEGYLFGGDTLVPRGVLLNLDYSLPPATLAQSMEKLKLLQPRIRRVFPGHHAPECKATLIDDYLEVCALAQKEPGTIVADAAGMTRLYQNANVRLACKIKYD